MRTYLHLANVLIFLSFTVQALGESLPVNYGIIVFPAFQALDVFGPLDIFNLMSFTHPLNLSIIASTLDPVSTKPRMPTAANSNFSQSIFPTHTFSTAPDDIEVLIIPGGVGTRAPAPELDELVEYIKVTYPRLRYLIGICTGVGLIARTGILDGRPATGNKRSWAWVTAQSDRVNWVHQARWVVSGNIWTTSGIAAGIDGVFDFVKTVYGEDVANITADGLEYIWVLNSTYDPFADLYPISTD